MGRDSATIQAFCVGFAVRATSGCAAEALVQTRRLQAVPALIQALGDSEALGKFGDPQAVPPLMFAVRAAEALGKLGDPQAMPRAHPSTGG
jgi:HEAT repeat protein